MRIKDQLGSIRCWFGPFSWALSMARNSQERQENMEEGLSARCRTVNSRFTVKYEENRTEMQWRVTDARPETCGYNLHSNAASSLSVPNYCFEFMPFHWKRNNLLRTHRIKAPQRATGWTKTIQSGVNESSLSISNRCFNCNRTKSECCGRILKKGLKRNQFVSICGFLHVAGRGPKLWI